MNDIPFQIRIFCLNKGLNLKMLKMSPKLFTYMEIVADQHDHFTGAFVREDLVYMFAYDVVITADAILFRDFKSKDIYTFMLYKQCFV